MRSSYPSNVIFENETMEGQRLELGDHNFRFYLGPNLVMRRCTLVLRVSSNLFHLAGPRFIDCAIEVKRQLKEVRWFTAHLKGCRFTGRLFSCDFGRLPASKLLYEDIGGIEDCDFTAAHVHACRFFGCDTSTLKLPRWPYFTLLEPYRRYREFASMMWPREIRSWFTGFELFHANAAALTYSATVLAKQAGVSEDRLRALVEGRSDILY
jgi:hypothetical protein